MAYNYAVLGAGRQGTAAAYDLAKRGDADRVVLADAHLEQAQAAAQRVNALLGSDIAEALRVDVADHDAVVRVLRGIDAFLSAVPYYYNLDITRAAIEAGASMCDLGGNTDIVRQQQALNAEAQAKGISIIPDCGQVPGMGTTLMVYAMSLLDEPREVTMWDGGLPQTPKPPFKYLLTFNVAGLTNEYAEPAVFIRGGQVTEVEPITELHTVEFPPPIGTLEAFVTGGTRHDTGAGTAWRHHEITEAELIANGVNLTSAMRIRYTANDANPQSIVEAGIDAFFITRFECGESCPGDFDGDGDVDTADLLFLLGAWGTPDGDVDGDGDTDTADLLALLGAWGECP
ncbi:MAG: saccharopine dehydrogenase NADP-binding domain-containing protein [Chloroflexota bacterium]|nr:saccharopine dehydrogenase NADP-binding domain-containing protein [Chloroflexota bacterium]